VIIGYLRFYFDKPSVLDLGCGHVRLLQLLEPHFHDYTGIDISAEAINCARDLNIMGAHFVVSRFEDYLPKEKVDVIIFNESLGYTERPADLVEKFSHHLLPAGKIVISQLASGHHRAMWRSVSAQLELVTGVQIRSARGQIWNVRVFERK
jgi:SAM-dependent methyltransferase